MKRREFLTGLASTAAALPGTANGQHALPVVGYLAPMAPKNVQSQTAAFLKGLAEAGFDDGKNVNVEYRWGQDRIAQLPALATDLVHRKVDVIAAFSTVAARAAKNATASIPIVFMTGDDPIASGIVASLNRPGANVTGITFSASEVATKRFELLRGLVPAGSLIAVLNDPNSPESKSQSHDATRVAQSLGQAMVALDIGSVGEIDRVFEVMVERKVSGLFVAGSPFLNAHRHRLTELAARHKFPSVYANRNFAEAGGLISYGASVLDAYRQAGVYVGRVLKGAQPAELPVLQPTKFEFVLNLKTAKAIGIIVPDRLLALADEVIN